MPSFETHDNGSLAGVTLAPNKSINGIVLVDKPAGITSAEVVRQVKARVRPARVGHLGTLDPFATGLLPILIGQATKLADLLEHGAKEYEGVIALGAETDTLDLCGRIVREAPVPLLDSEMLAQVAAGFVGRTEQVPPVFSAIKREGVPLYKLARRGDAVAPAPARMIEISRLELLAEGGALIRFNLECSPGTYVRSLARDIGVALGSAAHLVELRRVRSSGFSIAEAHTLEETLSRLGEGSSEILIGMRPALGAMVEVSVDESVKRRLWNGDWMALDGQSLPRAGPFKIICEDDLVAIAQLGPDRRAKLLRVFQA